MELVSTRPVKRAGSSTAAICTTYPTDVVPHEDSPLHLDLGEPAPQIRGLGLDRDVAAHPGGVRQPISGHLPRQQARAADLRNHMAP